MKWLVSAILLGLLGLFFFTDSLKIADNRSTPSVGRVLEAKGQVMGLSVENSSFVNIEAKSGLLSPHEIKTGIESHSLIEYGETFKLLPNSSARLIKLQNEYNIHLLSGQIERNEPAANTSFFVKEKKVNGLHLRVPSIQPTTTIDKSNLQQQSPLKKSQPKSKQAKKLEETFKLHQRFLEKCFIKHYERQEGNTSAGVITSKFIITKKGKLTQVEIVKSNYTDSEFHQCVQDVVSRVRIRNYNGNSTEVEFPLNFSLPH